MIVEELIGRLQLQTKGVKDARDAVKVLADLRKALKGLAGSTRTKLDGPARMARGLKDARREAERMAAAQRKAGGAGGFDKADASAKKHLSTLQRLRSAYADVAKSQAALGRGPRGSGRSWISGELDALRRYKREMKDVRREAARRGVPRHRADSLSRVPYGDRHPVGEAVGGGLIGAGVARGSKYAVMQGANQRQETNRQFNAGMEAEQVARLDKLSMELSAQYPSLDATKIRQMGRDARNMFPNFEKGMQALPEIVKAQVMLQAAKGVDAADNEMGDFLKGADILGHTEDVGDFKDLLNSYVKAVQVEGRQLPLSEYKNLAKYSKAGGVNLSNEFMGAIAPTFMQSEGGGRFGTQIAAGIKSMISGRRTKKSTAALKKYGLLDKKGNLINAEKYQSNPYQFAIEDMMPKLKRGGIDVDNDKAVQSVMAQIYSDAMTENLMTKLITQRAQVERNIKTYRGANGIDAAKDQTRGDPYVGFEGLVAQIRNFLGVTQSENVAGATKGLARITEAIGDFNKKLAGDPATAQAVGVGEAGAAAAVGGWGIYKFIQGARRVLGLGGEAKVGGTAAEAAAESAKAGPKVGPQASAMDTAARGIARGAAAAAFPITAGLTKGDQDSLVKRLGAYAQQQQEAEAELDREIRRGREMTERGRQRTAGVTPEARAELDRETRRGREMTERGRPQQPAIPTLPGGASGALPRMLQNPGLQFGAVAEKLAEIQASAQKVITTLDQSVQIKVDASQIHAAQAAADKLKATMGSIGGVSGGLGSLAVGLHKSGNTFTSPGATAP